METVFKKPLAKPLVDCKKYQFIVKYWKGKKKLFSPTLSRTAVREDTQFHPAVIPECEVLESTKMYRKPDRITVDTMNRIGEEMSKPVWRNHEKIRVAITEPAYRYGTMMDQLEIASTPSESKGNTKDNQTTLNQQGKQCPVKSIILRALPKVELPRFDGNPLAWPPFISLIKSLVHDQLFSDTQRMTPSSEL